MSLNAESNTPTLATPSSSATATRGIPMTVFQDNASAFATKQPEAIDMERRSAVRRALKLIGEGRRGRAEYELARSVMHQARVAGLKTWPIGPSCPCGGHRCAGCPS